MTQVSCADEPAETNTKLILFQTTRMHSSRIRTVCSSADLGGLHQAIPLEQAHPPEQVAPGAGTPLGPDNPPGTRQPPRDQAQLPVDRHTPVNMLPCPRLRLQVVKIYRITF